MISYETLGAVGVWKRECEFTNPWGLRVHTVLLVPPIPLGTTHKEAPPSIERSFETSLASFQMVPVLAMFSTSVLSQVLVGAGGNRWPVQSLYTFNLQRIVIIVLLCD